MYCLEPISLRSIWSKMQGAPPNKRNREQRTENKNFNLSYCEIILWNTQFLIDWNSCSLFSVPCSFYCAELLTLYVFQHYFIVNSSSMTGFSWHTSIYSIKFTRPKLYLNIVAIINLKGVFDIYDFHPLLLRKIVLL